jgi:hypothetical protein
MALTRFQHKICRLIAQNRIHQGESYVAGGVALNLITQSGRISRDIDLFHDTTEALSASWDADRRLLLENGFDIEIIHERPSYVEAIVKKGKEFVLMQWTRDSAFRFFPLVTHKVLGLSMHPFDLATNKTLALVGRLEIRDWVDVIACHDRIQRLAYLVWAACGKDPGFSPLSILELASQSGRYSEIELMALSFRKSAPPIDALSRKWHDMLEEAREIVNQLPTQEIGKCVIDLKGNLYSGDLEQLQQELPESRVLFHTGSIRGAFPHIL